MNRPIKLNFYRFWQGFPPSRFEWFFPFLKKRYEYVIADDPDLAIFSIFKSRPPPPDNCVRLFFSHEAPALSGRGSAGPLGDPDMANCEFSISSVIMDDNPNHLFLPNWAMPGHHVARGLVKRDSDRIDWERVLTRKCRFCNFISSHDTKLRMQVFRALNARRHVDAPGASMTNTERITTVYKPGWVKDREIFIRQSRFSLAIENTIWPGYHTEKLVDSMRYRSIPIYIGDPVASNVFNTKAYFDITQYRDLDEMFDHVLAVDDDPELYFAMLTQPHFRDNIPPAFCDESRIIAFFDRIFAEAALRIEGKNNAA